MCGIGTGGGGKVLASMWAILKELKSYRFVQTYAETQLMQSCWEQGS